MGALRIIIRNGKTELNTFIIVYIYKIKLSLLDLIYLYIIILNI